MVPLAVSNLARAFVKNEQTVLSKNYDVLRLGIIAIKVHPYVTGNLTDVSFPAGAKSSTLLLLILTVWHLKDVVCIYFHRLVAICFNIVAVIRNNEGFCVL